jgi:proteasome lid subunit RPN8/RPN11
LGTKGSAIRTIEHFVPYDEVDPNCLQGTIEFDGSKMDLVWDECRRLGLRVVADVHTHPHGFMQSGADRANPMIPESGHIALIVPKFASKDFFPGQIGIFEFLGVGQWVNHRKKGPRFFR